VVALEGSKSVFVEAVGAELALEKLAMPGMVAIAGGALESAFTRPLLGAALAGAAAGGGGSSGRSEKSMSLLLVVGLSAIAFLSRTPT
jgi:hypothetical protein